MHLCAVARLTARVVFLDGRVEAWSTLCAMRVVFIFQLCSFLMPIYQVEYLQKSDEGIVSMCQKTPPQ